MQAKRYPYPSDPWYTWQALLMHNSLTFGRWFDILVGSLG